MNIVLGSTSPRRKAILSGLFESFEIAAPAIEEIQRPGEDPVKFATRISENKCISIINSYSSTRTPALIMTADTIVTIDNAIIGKPVDYSDAVRILSLLSGRTHRVITGCTFAVVRGNEARPSRLTRHEVTEVKFKKLTRENIASYLSSIHYLDKAGSYALQENGTMIIETYRGSVTNIIGFPLRLFFTVIGELGLTAALFS